MSRVKRTPSSFQAACWLFLSVVTTAVACRGEEVTFSIEAAKSLSWLCHDRLVRMDAKSAPLRDGGAYVAGASFDSSVLRFVPDARIKKIELVWTAGYCEGEGTCFIEMHPLKRPLADGWSDRQLVSSSKELIAYDQSALARIEMSWPRPTRRQSYELPTTASMLASLNRGVGLTFRKTSGSLLQLNVNVRERGKEGDASDFLRLRVTVETPCRRLSLRPIVKIDPDRFVTVDKTGDLVYGGKKLRLSGVNLARLDGYDAIDACLDRLAALNVNAVRLWDGFERADFSTDGRLYGASEPKRKSGSRKDLFDYQVAACGSRDIFVHCTSLGHSKFPSAWQDVGKDGCWIFPELIEHHCAHIRSFLGHVNPYTGRTNGDMSVFATYELFNEDRFIPNMMSGCFRKWSAEHQSALKSLFCRFLEGKYGRPMDREPGAENGKADFLEFVMKCQIAANAQYESAVRSCGRAGRGVAVAPIVHGTHAVVSLHAQYVHQCGQGASTGVYQCLGSWNRDDPFFPYSPYFTKHPSFYNLNFGASHNKFFMVYEHHPHGPCRYRAEWFPQMTMLAAGNAWDALYLYAFYLSSRVSDDFDLACAGAMVPEPIDTSHYGYCEYFKAAGDEILCGGLAVCGQAFMNGLKPHDGQTVVSYGRTALYDPAYEVYSPSPVVVHGGAFAELADSQVSDGDNYKRAAGLYSELVETSFRHQLSLDFDENESEPITVKGELFSADVTPGDRKPTYPRIKPNDELTWDPLKAISSIDAVHSKIAVGVLPKRLEFDGGVAFEQDTPLPTAFFGLSARDGKAIADSSEMILNVASTAENTGYRFDATKMKPGVLGLIPAIVNRGTTPVRVVRPSGVVSISGTRPFRLERYNFARFCYATETVCNGNFRIEADEPLFLARIVRKSSE